MPPLPAVPNVARVRLYGHIATHEWQLVDYFHWAAGSPAAGDMHDMALAYGGILASSPFSTTDISHECVTDHCSAEDLTTTSGEFADVLTPGTGGATQATHANAAVLLSQHVSRRFRGGHGRKYIPGMSDDNVNDGRSWLLTPVNDILTAYNAAIAGTLAGGYSGISGLSHVMVSFYLGFTVNPVTGKRTPIRRVTPQVDVINNTSASTIIRSQRRRVRNTPTPS